VSDRDQKNREQPSGTGKLNASLRCGLWGVGVERGGGGGEG